jgi:hypothetical protein
MLLRSVPLFEGMTTRQLMDVADVVGILRSLRRKSYHGENQR